MTKYLLSTGDSTTKVEYYIIDLFKIYLNVYSRDIPNSSIGFNFILTNTKKDELLDEIKGRIDNLINVIKSKVSSDFYKISLQELSLIDETKARLIINVNEIKSSEIVVDIKSQTV